MIAKSNYKTNEIEIELKGNVYNVTANWEDTSFAHDFGTQVQGQWNVVYVELNGVDVTGTISDNDFDSLILRTNQELEY